MQRAVVALGLDTPPVSPDAGECWIVGPAPDGSWSGHAHALVGWTAGGWRFVAARPGMMVWDLASGQSARFDNGEWVVGRVAGSCVTINGVQVVARAAPPSPPRRAAGPPMWKRETRSLRSSPLCPGMA